MIAGPNVLEQEPTEKKETLDLVAFSWLLKETKAAPSFCTGVELPCRYYHLPRGLRHFGPSADIHFHRFISKFHPVPGQYSH